MKKRFKKKNGVVILVRVIALTISLGTLAGGSMNEADEPASVFIAGKSGNGHTWAITASADNDNLLEESSDNGEADTFAVSVSVDDEQSRDSGFEDAGILIESADIQEIKSIIDEFAASYFDGDTDALQKFLTSPYEWDIDAYEGTGTVSDFTIKGLPDVGERNAENRLHIELEFMDSDDDSYTYLCFYFVKQEGDWKIQSYGLEK